jgi:hypothetical protein
MLGKLWAVENDLPPTIGVSNCFKCLTKMTEKGEAV